MLSLVAFSFILVSWGAGIVRAHASIWHPSMYGFKVTDQMFPSSNVGVWLPPPSLYTC
ncbi:hypothetical protein VTO73DRAFT_8582 [Trametes versicolor]